MFYSSEAPNGTPTIQPEQTIEFAFWKTVKTLWWSRTLKMIVRQAMSQKGSTSIRRDCTKRDPGHCRDCHHVTEYFPPSLRRNIHFPLRCGKNSAIFASLVVTHLARQDKHQCILPNVSTLSTTRSLPFFFPQYQQHHSPNVCLISMVKKICPFYHNIILLLFMKGRHHCPRLFPLPNYHIFCRSHKSFFREEKQDYRAHWQLLFALYLPRSDSQTVAPMHTCPPWTGTSADLPWGRCCVKR